MDNTQLKELLEWLTKQSSENEWIEFKLNFHSEEEIWERISALANGACINNQKCWYLVFGVEDETQIIKWTTFKPRSHKKWNEPLENWLANRLDPKIDFSIKEFQYDEDRHITLFIIPAAKNIPVKFTNLAYIRIWSVTRKLKDFPDKESKIWKKNHVAFEKEIAKDNLTSDDIIKYLSTETYFDLMNIPYPSNRDGVIEKFVEEWLIIREPEYAITKLWAILFAKNFKDFEGLERKSVRVIIYQWKNKVNTEREQIGGKWYALGFSWLIDWINSQLPANEEIWKALRTDKRMYPEIAIRELVANALIHQDLNEKWFPMIEVFIDRIEISNPWKPLIKIDRFIDAYQSRNDKLADLMRRMWFCEEKGSGLDKVIFYNELYQLPPLNFNVSQWRTKVSIYSYKELRNLDKKEKIRACYQHSSLKYVSNEKMTNQSLRERFQIEDHNYSTASRIIKDTLEEWLIKDDDPESKSKKYASYIPFWA